MPALILGCGVFLTLRSSFFQLRSFPLMLDKTIGGLFRKKKEKADEKGITPWQSVSTALASTIGTGSIAGMAVAIQLGGAGSVFWMWVSSFFGMIIKFAEINLSMHFREKDRGGGFLGGPMFVLKNALRKPRLGVFFAISALGATFAMGNAVQTSAIVGVLEEQYHLQTKICVFLLLVIVGAFVLGGMKRIGKINSYLVPLMAIVYLFSCLVILMINIQSLPSVLERIFREAFSFSSALGGAAYLGIRHGFSKGIFSSEAGLGSAAIAHASADTKNVPEHSLWGCFEVFFTTVVVCTMTSLVLLVSPVTPSALSGAERTLYAFESQLPKFGGFCVTWSTVLFSLSSILGWAFYGEVCIRYLFSSKKWVLFFRYLFLIVLSISSFLPFQFIWNFAEVMNAFMVLPNLFCIVFLWKIPVQDCKKLKKEGRVT